MLMEGRSGPLPTVPPQLPGLAPLCLLMVLSIGDGRESLLTLHLKVLPCSQFWCVMGRVLITRCVLLCRSSCRIVLAPCSSLLSIYQLNFNSGSKGLTSTTTQVSSGVRVIMRVSLGFGGKRKTEGPPCKSFPGRETGWSAPLCLPRSPDVLL